MGDARFDKPYEQIKEAMRPAELLRSMASEDVIAALAAASRQHDPLLANVLATEAQNRVIREATAIEQLGHGVYVVDASARVVYINQAGADMLQRPASDILGQPSRDVIHLIDPSLAEYPELRPDEVALATGLTIETEHGILRAQGTRGPLLIAYSAVPLHREDEVTGVVVGFRDITERRRSQEALARSEERHRLLLDVLPDAIVVIDQTGRIRYANPAAHELFGGFPVDLVGGMFGIPSVDPKGSVVDVSIAGGSWRRARLRTVAAEWEHEPAFLTIYSQI